MKRTYAGKTAKARSFGENVYAAWRRASLLFFAAVAAAAPFTAFSGTQIDIKATVTNAVNVVFGVVVFGGVINIVRGISMIAKGLQDDGGGQDAAAISKGRGMLIAGIIMVAPEPIFLAITGQSAGAFVASFF